MKRHPEIKADPLSRAAFIGWLAQQDPNERYSFTDPYNCALGRWVRSVDPKARPYCVGGCVYFAYFVNGEIHNFSHLRFIAGCSNYGAFTFGAALARAKES